MLRLKTSGVTPQLPVFIHTGATTFNWGAQKYHLTQFLLAEQIFIHDHIDGNDREENVDL